MEFWKLKSESILLYIFKDLSSSLAVFRSNIPQNFKSQNADPTKVFKPIISSLHHALKFSPVKKPRQEGMDR
jgi:hypothetical protein